MLKETIECMCVCLSIDKIGTNSDAIRTLLWNSYSGKTAICALNGVWQRSHHFLPIQTTFSQQHLRVCATSGRRGEAVCPLDAQTQTTTVVPLSTLHHARSVFSTLLHRANEIVPSIRASGHCNANRIHISTKKMTFEIWKLHSICLNSVLFDWHRVALVRSDKTEICECGKVDIFVWMAIGDALPTLILIFSISLSLSLFSTQHSVEHSLFASCT